MPLTEMQRMLRAMGGEWTVVRYELLDDDRVRVHLRSNIDPNLDWGYCPLTPEMERLPPVGATVRMCVLTLELIEQLGLGLPKEDQT